ncbi:methionine adenosyltransferase domain-containing protein, partial [Adlercreutzia sp. DFI.6.23]|uniref:methionine adenosyltransferase domain-containing protein n=1 Tax=Adlercreutzia sp. DFI.6.23 TaxID=2963705 RepID=UPI00210C5B6F
LVHVVIALAGSRVLKAVVVAGVGALGTELQIAADAVAVIVCGTCLIAATRALAHVEGRHTSTEWKLPVTERAGFIGCEVQIAYAIGVAKPVSVMVETFGT